jgi:hypothetical protein
MCAINILKYFKIFYIDLLKVINCDKMLTYILPHIRLQYALNGLISCKVDLSMSET